MDIGQIIKEYGLPIAMLLGFVWLTTGEKSRLVSRGQLDDANERADYNEKLYQQERTDRIAAQKAAEEFAPANAKVAQAVAGLSEEVVKRLPIPTRSLYEERLDGN